MYNMLGGILETPKHDLFTLPWYENMCKIEAIANTLQAPTYRISAKKYLARWLAGHKLESKQVARNFYVLVFVISSTIPTTHTHNINLF